MENILWSIDIPLKHRVVERLQAGFDIEAIK